MQLPQPIENLIRFFRDEANEARALASTFTERHTVDDLRAFAREMDLEADELDSHPPRAGKRVRRRA
ncbi:MAG: hypothetical protein KGJ78_11260 [Alphaproteobacteria bacterium]|nr:hypothetical protein [Alphaproteobacteria bacterium]